MTTNCNMLPQDAYKALPWKPVGAWELQLTLRVAGQKSVRELIFPLFNSYSNSFSSAGASAHRCEWA